MRKQLDEERSEKLHDKMISISASISEEFDILETVEDDIKDMFSCDMDCVTCTEEERGICMQTFKKANLYWIRKIAQDERMLESVVQKMDEYRELLTQATQFIRDYIDIKDDEPEKKLNSPKKIDYKKRAKEFQRGLGDLYV